LGTAGVLAGGVGRRRQIWMVEFSERVTLYGGRERATSTIFLGGYSPQRAEAGSCGGASRYEWGGQWQTTISRHAGATCCGLRSGASVSVMPISRQHCYPFWACNGTWPAVRRRPPAVVPLSKEWTGQGTRSRLITLICVQGTMLLFDNRLSAASFTGRAGVSSREESSAWHAQLSFSPAATRLVSDGRPGALAHGVVALRSAAQCARFGLCGAARSNCGRNTGVSGARESVGNQRSS
jgi:hypothetical protein